MALFIVLINLYGYILMGIDKKRAREHKWRISESHLWVVCLLFGSAGIGAGMYYFRHKTKHISFRLGVPVCFILHVGLGVYYFMFY
ncbi:DUF1294 domain-containing protein [Bacillus gobiensis]|uniref:DUF1294 domain-containing protein n=1 Tax=Bacillus gobiensis TaxID=1441095 RepID=UPI003D1AC59E